MSRLQDDSRDRSLSHGATGPSAAGLLAEGTRALEAAFAAGVDTPRLDADVLLRHVLGQSREEFMTRLAQLVSGEDAGRYRGLLERRARGEPVAYLTGTKEFYGLPLEVGRGTLVPRPETETLVEAAIRRAPSGALAADVGTGSGAIAVALAAHRPDVRVVGTDRSAEALAVARRNAPRHSVDRRVGFVECDLAAALGARIQVIVANLPYIPTSGVDHLALTVRAYEPRLALDGGGDGLDVYRRLLDQLRLYHREVALLCCEIGAEQARSMCEEIANRYRGAAIEVLPDLSGVPRVVVARL